MSNQKSFVAVPGTSLLDAAALAGLMLEHSCRSGRCGNCKAQLISGQVQSLQPDLALSPAQQADGWVLTCAVEACSNVQLALNDLGGELKLMKLPARLDALDRPAADVLRLSLRLPPNSGFKYLAGQHIELLGADGIRRSYSLASAPQADGKLELHIRRVDGGAMSEYWFMAAKVNDLLRFEGPRGSFFLRDVTGLDLVFLATGTGIAPIKAMLESLALRPADAQPRSIELYWGGRRPEDLYWTPPGMVAGVIPLSYIPVLSQADPHWQGARGHVQQELLRRHAVLNHAAVYACGSSAMIHNARSSLQLAGLPESSFYSDAFVSA
ncbi:FAD-binding oxidoreductase [Paucibacter oligotrophus]|uniref:FAD-binding oxidoreductase n=1 Tax=Roseateles oligotrophus TaxID=1769250 RepID=A0ABT2YM99_9BURK|nr:FAD-binding oxidoreductase [Roseateles oligotrophus]